MRLNKKNIIALGVVAGFLSLFISFWWQQYLYVFVRYPGQNFWGNLLFSSIPFLIMFVLFLTILFFQKQITISARIGYFFLFAFITLISAYAFGYIWVWARIINYRYMNDPNTIWCDPQKGINC